MKNNLFVKFLCSIPIILIFLYFIPFLGICLLLLRCFFYSNKKKISTPIILILVALLILIPKGLENVFNIIKFDITAIPYYNDVINSNLYNVKFIKFSKTLFTVGILYIILSALVTSIFNKISNKLSSGIKNYINESEKRNAEISQKNDLIMKEKREIAKNSSYVKCPKCGSDNIIGEKFGTCKYCRGKIINNNYKE